MTDFSPFGAQRQRPARKSLSRSLKKRWRPHEIAIECSLFACGLLSIFTALGIILVLGNESVAFFTRDQWVNSNLAILSDIDEDSTVITVEAGKALESLAPGSAIRIGQEVMEVTQFYNSTKEIEALGTGGGYLSRIAVKRGVRGGHTIAPHRAGIAVEYNDRPTITEFFSNTNWIPAIGEFGVLPLINATLMTSAIAMLVALPLGLGAAIYLSEYASDRVRKTLKPVLEILAGIPTVVYGYFALTFMTPLLRHVFGADVVNIYNTGSAGIVVGILIIPLVSSMSEDALHAVPDALREASYGLGATKLETVIKVVAPAALSGILAAFIVAASRAIGETMIVAIAAGAGPNLSFNPFDSAETMTGHIARISGGDLSYDSIDYNSIFAIGLTLFVMTFTLNALSRVIITRFREAY